MINFSNWAKKWHYGGLLLCLLTYSFPLIAEIKVQEFDTAKKMHVLFVPDPSSDLVSVHFAFKGAGTAADLHGKEGLATLMTNLLLERTTEGSDRHTLQKKLKALGIIQGIHSSIDSDNIHFYFKAPKEKLKEVFDIIKIIITSPTFDAKELEKMKSFDPAGSRLATSTEQEFALKTLLHKVFSPHPYGIPPAGTLDGRQSITIADIKRAIQERFARNVLVFSVIGDIPPKTLAEYIDAAFGSLPEKAKLTSLANATPKLEGDITVIPKESPHSGVVFGTSAVSINDPDALPMLILNDVLGGKPFTSRLWLEAREKQGLVYSIHTNFLHWHKADLWLGSFESANPSVEKVIAMIKQDWKDVHDKGITEAEFKASKTGLMGGYALAFITPDGIAQYVLALHLAGIPVNYINERNKKLEALTLEEVNKVAAKRLDPNTLTFVVVGNPSN